MLAKCALNGNERWALYRILSLSLSNSRKEGMKIPDLLRDLARDLIGPHRVLVGLFPEAEVEPDKDEREGDAKPHAEKGQHGGEGNST